MPAESDDARTVLRILEEHRTDHPQGLKDSEFLEYEPELTLRRLQAAVSQLEAEGKVRRALTDIGQYRIALPGVHLEDVPVGSPERAGTVDRPPPGADRSPDDVREEPPQHR